MKIEKKYILVFILLIFPILLCGENKSLKDIYKKWSYRQNRWKFRGGFQIDMTYISDELIDKWYSSENSNEIKKRIQTLKNKLKDKRYLAYMITLFPRPKDGITKLTLEIKKPTKKNIYLNIVEEEPKKYYPKAMSGNLNNKFSVKNSMNTNFYGIVVFKASEDCYSFQTIILNLNFKIFNYKNELNDNENYQFQFSFLPNGVPIAQQPPKREIKNFDVIGVLSFALDIISFLIKI